MKRHVFIDADIILDLFLERRPFFDASARLFMKLQDEELEGSVSPLIFSNLFYILRKELSKEEALNALRKLRLLVGVLPMDHAVVDRALASSFTDFEDAMQYYTAATHEVDAIITRNKKDFRHARLPVFTADEWLQETQSNTVQ